MAYKNNPYYGNPYLPRMPYPQYGQPMRTPEQYKADLIKQLQPNLDIYNQQYAEYQKQQTVMANSGQYVKVASYDEVKGIQAPSDGRPVIIIDDVNGFLYSKKFENGQEYIKGFRLVPNEPNVSNGIENESEKETSDKNAINDTLNKIMERLDKLEGKSNGVSRPIDEQAENTEPSRV